MIFLYTIGGNYKIRENIIGSYIEREIESGKNLNSLKQPKSRREETKPLEKNNREKKFGMEFLLQTMDTRS